MLFPRIRELREENKLSQTAVAKALSITPHTYSRYEIGKGNLPGSAAAKLALHYEVRADYILGLTDIREPYP
jgi:transcriptional regulator with XRE-family HTH domain